MSRSACTIVLIMMTSVGARSAAEPVESPEQVVRMTQAELRAGLERTASRRPLNADLTYLYGLALLGRTGTADGTTAAGDGESPPLSETTVETLSRASDWRLRRLAAMLLERVSREGGLEAVHMNLLGDSHWRVRHEAILALRVAPRPWAAEQIGVVLKQSGPDSVFERRVAVRVADDLALVDALLQGCYDPDGDVQLHSVWGLDRWMHKGRTKTHGLSPSMRVAFEHVARNGAQPRAREAARDLLIRSAEKPALEEKTRFEGESKP